MTDTRSDAERLSAAIARFGLDRLVNDPELCRNVLSDLFPSDPLTAPLLAAAAAERVPTRLAADRGRIDAAVLIPQLGSALAAARGLRDDYAERAVRTWAAALRIDAGTGRDTAPTPPTTGDAPPAPPRENLVSEEHGRASPELETVTRESPPSPAPPAAPAPVPAPAPAAEREPPPALAARRRWPILVLAAAAVVLLVLTGVGIAIWRIASAVAGAPAVTVRTAAGAAGTITTSDTTKAIDGTQALQAGQTVTASKGLIEVNDARGVVMRLDAGAQVVYLRAATDKAIAQFELMTGRVYLNASGGRSVGVQSPAGDAEVGSGRLAIACSGSACTFQALEEGLDVHTRRGGTVRLEPHQRVVAAAASGSSAGAETAGYVAPDALREDPWLAANIGLDHDQGRPGAALAGERLLGEWVFGYDSRYAGTIYHPVTIAANCTPTGCALTAKSVYATCPSSASTCAMTGPVEVADRSGSKLKIAYPEVAADCSGDRKRDGAETLTDELTVSAGTSVSGARTAVLRSDADSICANQAAEFRQQTLPIRASHVPLGPALFPQPGDEERLLIRHVSYTRLCTRASKRPRALADITCTFQGDKDAGGRTRPARVEFALFGSAEDQAAAYAAIAAPTHLHETGNCSTGPCEYPFSGAPGRKVVFGPPGSVQLAAYQPADGRMLLIASGGQSAGQINTWYHNTADFAPRGFLVNGF